MKILYITNYYNISKASGGFINDYLNDLLFYGLTELENIEVIDSTPIIHLYKENKDKIDLNSLWGKGFTSTFLIDKDKVDRSNIEYKIKNYYFDLIIYGNIRRCQDYYSLISQYYPQNKIFCIDGNDDTFCDSQFYIKHKYFKRELIEKHENLIPIYFAIPEQKISKEFLPKVQEYASIIPGIGGYVFNNEKEYYDDYNKSYYGVTMKKAGWDCMRHYEILANNCIPYFIDLEKCPENILINLPKQLLVEIKNTSENIDEIKYREYLNILFNYTKENLTTKKLAQYVLNHV